MRLCVRFLALDGLPLWLALDAVSLQQRPAELFTRHVERGRQADPEVQNQIDDAFRAFEDLLTVSRSAAACSMEPSGSEN